MSSGKWIRTEEYRKRASIITKNAKRKPKIYRFWHKVDITDLFSCWNWLGHKNKLGYGTIDIKYKSVLAHRFFWSLYYGDIPKGFQINHKCDNPSCVNPAHLYLGTQKDNVKDRVNRNRSNTSTLTKNDVINIRCLRKEGKLYSEIAQLFNINQSSIGRICRYERWNHIL